MRAHSKAPSRSREALRRDELLGPWFERQAAALGFHNVANRGQGLHRGGNALLMCLAKPGTPLAVEDAPEWQEVSDHAMLVAT